MTACYKSVLILSAGVTYQAVLKQFEEGDVVKVQVKLEDFEKLQEGRGGWTDSMSEVNILKNVGYTDLTLSFMQL